MSRALVFGAGGVLGYHIVRALVVEGWNVTGVVRSDFDVNQLLLLGATPLQVTEVTFSHHNSPIVTAITESSLIIDAGLPTNLSLELLEAISVHSPTHARKRAIFTAGSALFVSRGDSPVDESSPFNAFPGLQRLHPLVRNVGTTPNVIASVMAPSIVYGGWFPKWEFLFEFNSETKKIDFPGSPAKRSGFIHVYDVATAYAAVAGAPAGDVAGQVFLIANDERITLLDLWRSLAKAAGSNGEVNFVAPSQRGYLSFIEEMDQVVDASKLKRLGWRPKHTAVSKDEASRLYATFKAWKAARPEASSSH